MCPLSGYSDMFKKIQRGCKLLFFACRFWMIYGRRLALWRMRLPRWQSVPLVPSLPLVAPSRSRVHRLRPSRVRSYA
ncbi:MAG: hypothetical protein ACKO37_01815 [Vampirovibrionales bacterium]